MEEDVNELNGIHQESMSGLINQNSLCSESSFDPSVNGNQLSWDPEDDADYDPSDDEEPTPPPTRSTPSAPKFQPSPPRQNTLTSANVEQLLRDVQGSPSERRLTERLRSDDNKQLQEDHQRLQQENTRLLQEYEIAKDDKEELDRRLKKTEERLQKVIHNWDAEIAYHKQTNKDLTDSKTKLTDQERAFGKVIENLEHRNAVLIEKQKQDALKLSEANKAKRQREDEINIARVDLKEMEERYVHERNAAQVNSH